MSQFNAFGSAKTIGQRKAQEDSIAWTDELVDGAMGRPRLVVVADGMGGHAAGDVASELAVKSFITAYQRDTSGEATILREALDWANERLADFVVRNSSADGMGCTVVALELNEEGSAFRWLSVGDSLLLSIRKEGISRINEDHSFREERRRTEETGGDVSAVPSANMLRSAVMGSHIPLVDDHTVWRRFSEDEILVLATDGIETIEMERIAAIVRGSADAASAAEALIAAVEQAQRPRQDNTTVAVIFGGSASIGDVAAGDTDKRGERKPSPSGRRASRQWQVGLLTGLLAGLALGTILGALGTWLILNPDKEKTEEAADNASVTGDTAKARVPIAGVPPVPQPAATKVDATTRLVDTPAVVEKPAPVVKRTETPKPGANKAESTKSPLPGNGPANKSPQPTDPTPAPTPSKAGQESSQDESS